MLKYTNNQTYLEGIALDKIIKTHQTPFYIYSQKNITKKFNELKKILNSEIFYSVKLLLLNQQWVRKQRFFNLNFGSFITSLSPAKKNNSKTFQMLK